MRGDFRTNQERDVPVEEFDGEDAAEFRVLFSEHDDRAFEEADEAADEGKSAENWGEVFLRFGDDEGDDELGDGDGGEEEEHGVEELVAAAINDFHGDGGGDGNCDE